MITDSNLIQQLSQKKDLKTLVLFEHQMKLNMEGTDGNFL
jgi:hypothetical protein